MIDENKPHTSDVEPDENSAASAPAETPQTAQDSPSAEAPSLEEQIKKLLEEKRALYDQLLRRQADFENFRKRTEREQREFRQYIEAALVESLLPVLDAFERALAAPGSENAEEYRKGVELIYKQLFDILARAGLKPVEAVGKPFDPHYHHAVERVETTEHPDHEVLGEMQRGYLLKDRLLRPALVRVAVHPEQAAPSDAEPESDSKPKPEPEEAS